ncbi:MAG: pantetheine-phosphate adenylyltransferase [Tannerella sp.]|jgi:pantetheine-phosphate adenylyltransferase|nr:pantetheine-phosphate adenylyltransferase [Tannerella sp.]
MNVKRILFPGTFDPFTVGHQSLVKRALCIADKIIIAIGVNETKKSLFSIEKRFETITLLYKDEPRIKVMTYNCLTVDFAKEVNADFILRGVRSISDFEYEKTLADVNRRLTGIETLVLFSEPEYTHISSGMIRELIHYEKDISDYIPKI